MIVRLGFLGLVLQVSTARATPMTAQDRFVVDGQCIEDGRGIRGPFAQDDIVALPKDLHLVCLEAKLLWQSNGLAISGLKNAR